jgi:hypothetical protein
LPRRVTNFVTGAAKNVVVVPFLAFQLRISHDFGLARQLL